VTETNRRARFYELTPEGQQQLAQESATWRQYADLVSSILTASQAG
jgi:DNA-binding PadR family transcriptional regulator